MELIGVVDHWFGKIQVAGIEITGPRLAVGDTIRFAGNTTELTVTIESMQIDNEAVLNAATGDRVGVKVSDTVRAGDSVYLITPD